MTIKKKQPNTGNTDYLKNHFLSKYTFGKTRRTTGNGEISTDKRKKQTSRKCANDWIIQPKPPLGP